MRTIQQAPPATTVTHRQAAPILARQRGRVVAPASNPASFPVLAVLILVGTLLLPYGLVQASPGVVRLLFPGYALVVSLVVLNRWPTAYPALCVGFAAFAPFLRRLADFQAGFVQFNPILLAPLVVLIPALPSLFRRILTPGATLAAPLALMVGCVFYGSMLALFSGKIVQGLYEPGLWLLPPALATFVMERPAELGAIRRALTQTLMVVVPVISVYGVLQYVSPQPWDIIWMQNVDNATFGRPVPYEVRVFSMLNSPGTAGMFTSYALLVLCGSGIFGMLVGLASLPLLLLTVIRTAWLGAAAGLVAMMLLAPAKHRIQLAGVFVAAFVGLGALLSSSFIPVSISNMLSDRVQTFTNLSTDGSASDRKDTYASFYNRFAESPLGEGFGANGSATAASQKRALVALDSGFLEIFLTFGLPVGLVYMYFICAVCAAAWRGLRLSRGAFSSYYAVLVATIVIMPLTLSIVGETGALQWTPIGLLLAVAAAKPAGAR